MKYWLSIWLRFLCYIRERIELRVTTFITTILKSVSNTIIQEEAIVYWHALLLTKYQRVNNTTNLFGVYFVDVKKSGKNNILHCLSGWQGDRSDLTEYNSDSE